MSQTLDQLEPSAVQPSSAEPNFDEFAYKPIPPLAPVSALLGVCALSGLLSPLGVVFAVFGFVLGFLALRQIDQADGGLSGRKIAMTGVMTSAVLLVSGVALLEHLRWSWHSPWALTVLALFVFVGACWLPVVWIQLRLSRLANTAPSVSELPPAFVKLFRIWILLGIPAFACVMALVFMMVAKPLPVV